MTKLLSFPRFGFLTLSAVGLGLAGGACSSEDPGSPGAGATGAMGGTSSGSAGTNPGTGGSTAGSGTSGTPGTGGSTAGSTGVGGSTAGSTGVGGSTAGSTGVGGSTAGSTGVGGSTAGDTGAGGSTAGDTGAGGSVAGTGAGGSGGGEPIPELPPLVTSAQNEYWKTDAMPTEGSGAATVTVNESQVNQTWEGFGGSFNELGWSVLTTQEMKDAAIRLLFSATDGANLVWGRIPMGASDYARDRYTLNDTGEDVVAQSGEANRPPADNSLSMFSLARDEEMLIPYIKAAQALKPSIRFWASPWTPPVWMKTGYITRSRGTGGGDAVRPSYFDGGNMKGDATTLGALAQYFVKFVDGYMEKGINVEVVAPQNEPGYDQNYPTCLWDSTTYVSFIKDHLGPAMMPKGVKIMLGTMSNAGDESRNDMNIANAVINDATAKSFVSMFGAQWGILDQVNGGANVGGLPVWATEHKCGNYPWNPSGYPAYNMQQAPNDHPYGVESWGYIRNAIKNGKVTAYSAWNMVLDRNGLGNDTSRDWRQNALLVANGGQVTPTPYYYVFRHFAQYVRPGAQVLGVQGGDAVAFKNTDGSLVAVMYNSGAANPSYSVAMGGKTFQFAMPQNGWATVQYKP